MFLNKRDNNVFDKTDNSTLTLAYLISNDSEVHQKEQKVKVLIQIKGNRIFVKT